MTDHYKPLVDIINKLFEFMFGCTGFFGAESLIVKQSEIALMQKLWEMVVPIGIALSLVYFLIEINRTLMLEGSNMTMKSIGNPLLKFGISFCFLQWGGYIISDFLNFGNWLLYQVDGMNLAYSSETQTIADKMMDYTRNKSLMETLNSNAPFWTLMMFLIIALISFFTSLIVCLLIEFKCIILKFEVLLRVGLSPIVIGDIYDGKNSQAIRYLKKLLACFTYGAMMILIVKLGEGIVVATVGDSATSLLTADADWSNILSMSWTGAVGAFKSLFFPVIVAIAEVASFGMAQRMSNDVWGVG